MTQEELFKAWQQREELAHRRVTTLFQHIRGMIQNPIETKPTVDEVDEYLRLSVQLAMELHDVLVVNDLMIPTVDLLEGVVPK